MAARARASATAWRSCWASVLQVVGLTLLVAGTLLMIVLALHIG